MTNKTDREVLNDLVNATRRCYNTPVVDDDFPEMRHYADSALHTAEKHLKDTEPDKQKQKQYKSGLTFNALRAANIKRAIEWREGLPPDDLSFRLMEFVGEVGECLNEIKKYTRHLRGIKNTPGYELKEALEKVKDEIGDVFITTDRLAEILEIDSEDAIICKFNKTSDKINLLEKL